MGTREHNPLSSSNRVRDTKRKMDFNARTTGNQKSDNVSRGHERIVRGSVESDVPLHIPSPADYIRSMRIKENMTEDRLGIGLMGISHREDPIPDVPTEAQVKAFEALKHK